MRKLFYDLHLHSCLSPCGDNDMTPNNMAGMASLKGLQIAALTDHNSSKNCPAFLAACEKNGIVGIAGMELTTSEEIHLVCLFEYLDAALGCRGVRRADRGAPGEAGRAPRRAGSGEGVAR